MDLKQTDHLKAYGVTFHALTKGAKADWLLNYRGGSFMIDYSDNVAVECRVEGVAFETVTSSQAAEIYSFVQSEDNNMDVVRLEKAPKIAVYVPPGFQPWDDAVTLALEYAKVPYDKIWNDEILRGDDLLDPLQYPAARDIFVLRVGIREMAADVAQAGGAEQRVADGVRERVAVRVSRQAFVERNLHAAENQLPPRLQPMVVVPEPHAHP